MSELNPEDWVERYGNDLYRFALARLRHPQDAENAVSETLLAAITAQSSPACPASPAGGRQAGSSGKSSERTWLIGILKHKIVDHMRKNYRENPVTDLQENETAIDQFFDHKQQLKKIPSAWLPDPAELLKKEEFWKTFHECREKLPSAARDALILREIDCLDSRQICEILNITPSHLWVMLYRTRLQLRQCVEINWFERISRLHMLPKYRTNCKKALRLICEAMDHPLPWSQRVLLKIHLLMCQRCRYSRSQFQGLKELMAGYARYEAEHPCYHTAALSAEGMDRMKFLLRKERLI